MLIKQGQTQLTVGGDRLCPNPRASWREPQTRPEALLEEHQIPSLNTDVDRGLEHLLEAATREKRWLVE